MENIIYIDSGQEEYENDLDKKSVIILIKRNNINDFVDRIRELSAHFSFINLIKVNLENWTPDDIQKYEQGLNEIRKLILTKSIICNIFERQNKNAFMDCNAGVESFAVAPNGYVYICPAFYFQNADNYIAKIGDEIREQGICRREKSPVCMKCDNIHCRRCVFENYKSTGDICIPSYKQCQIAEIEEGVYDKNWKD